MPGDALDKKASPGGGGREPLGDEPLDSALAFDSTRLRGTQPAPGTTSHNREPDTRPLLASGFGPRGPVLRRRTGDWTPGHSLR